MFANNVSFWVLCSGFFVSSNCRNMLIKRYGNVSDNVQDGAMVLKVKFKLVFGAD